LSIVRRSLILSFVEKYSVLAITIVSTVVLARLLTPLETGLYSVAAGMVNLAQMVRELGVGTYIVQEQELTPARLGTALGISLVAGITVGGLFIAGSAPLAQAFGDPRLGPVIAVQSLNFFGVAVASVGFALLRRAMNFTAMLRIGIVACLAHGAASILLANWGYGALGMAWASVLNVAVTVAGVLVCHPGELLVRPRFGEWRRVLGFGGISAAGQVLQAVGERSPDIIVGRVLGFELAGLFSRGNSLVSLFEQALMDAITPVAHGAFAQISRARQDLAEPFLRWLACLTVVAWPALGLMAALATPIFLLAFGDQWLGAVPTGRVLCLAAAWWVIGRLCAALVNAAGTVRPLLGVQMVAVPVLVAALLAGAMVSIEAAAAGMVLSCALQAVLSLRVARAVTGTAWRSILLTMAQNAAITAITLAGPVLILALGLMPAQSPWLGAVTGGGVAVFCWLASVLVLDHPIKSEIATLFPRLRLPRTQPEAK
jgi:O-antigen/teichoic acid export membrane protein